MTIGGPLIVTASFGPGDDGFGGQVGLLVVRR